MRKHALRQQSCRGALRLTRYLDRALSADDPFVKCGIAQTRWQGPAPSANKGQCGHLKVPQSDRVGLCRNRENTPFANGLMRCGSRTDGQRVEAWRIGRRRRRRLQSPLWIRTKRVKSQRGRSAPKSHSLAAASQLVQAPEDSGPTLTKH
jgi:hypothetical protein